MTTTELKPKYDTRQSFYGKAETIHDGDTIKLKSYNTMILIYNTSTNILKFLTGNRDHFTATTCRHINEFLQQFTPYGKKTKKELLKMANI